MNAQLLTDEIESLILLTDEVAQKKRELELLLNKTPELDEEWEELLKIGELLKDNLGLEQSLSRYTPRFDLQYIERQLKVSECLVNKPQVNNVEIPTPVIPASTETTTTRTRRQSPVNNAPKMKDIKELVFGLLGVRTSKLVRRAMNATGFTCGDLRRKDTWQAILNHLNNDVPTQVVVEAPAQEFQPTESVFTGFIKPEATTKSTIFDTFAA